MSYRTTPEREKTRQDGEQAIKVVASLLSSAIATETASFMRHTSLQLYPEVMRGDPNTPAVTSLREHHFTILMTNVATAFADGRGQDFADDRVALGNLLDEEHEHKPLGARFSRLMALWLQDDMNKKRQEEMKKRRGKELEDEKVRVREEEKPEWGEDSGSDITNASETRLPASPVGQRDLEDDDNVASRSSAAGSTKDLVHPSAQRGREGATSDEETAIDDADETFSAEESTAYGHE